MLSVLLFSITFTTPAPPPHAPIINLRRTTPLLTANADEPQYIPPTALLCTTAALQSACFGCIGTALPPALRASGLAPAEVATLLGRLGSVSALFEVMLSGSFGKLADSIGRKPILLAAPAFTVLARAVVVFNPTLPVLLGARLATTLVVPMYWLAYQAACADCFGRNATQLAVLGSRVQASMGFGYALSSLMGGWLATRDIRYAYFASCTLGCCVCACVGFGLRETLPKQRRIKFKWAGNNPLGFINLFRRGVLAAKLNLCVVLQSLTNGMGDLWQVMARELRGWGAAQCGRFAALVGVSTMLGTLLTGPSLRRFGPRGHTVASTSCSACSALMLGRATSNTVAIGAVVPIALGAGKGQATGARIVNHIGEELGVPQGQLAAERNALNAVIKVLTPSLYAALFGFGVRRGVIGLPFFTTAFLLFLSAATAWSIPDHLWRQSDPQEAGTSDAAKAGAEVRPAAAKSE